MPSYQYRCKQCEKQFDRVLPMSQYNRPQDCGLCGAVMEKIITAPPAVRGDYASYSCPVTGKPIDGRKAHEDNLRRTGCRILEPGESQDAANFRTHQSNALEESIADTAARFVEALPAQKREKLAGELDSGLDVSISRT